MLLGLFRKSLEARVASQTRVGGIGVREVPPAVVLPGFRADGKLRKRLVVFVIKIGHRRELYR